VAFDERREDIRLQAAAVPEGTEFAEFAEFAIELPMNRLSAVRRPILWKFKPPEFSHSLQ
jgi:hypothetical protein